MILFYERETERLIVPLSQKIQKTYQPNHKAKMEVRFVEIQEEMRFIEEKWSLKRPLTPEECIEKENDRKRLEKDIEIFNEWTIEEMIKEFRKELEEESNLFKRKIEECRKPPRQKEKKVQ
jgi:hypothetical protein